MVVWCKAADVETFHDFWDLTVVEPFKPGPGLRTDHNGSCCILVSLLPSSLWSHSYEHASSGFTVAESSGLGERVR